MKTVKKGILLMVVLPIIFIKTMHAQNNGSHLEVKDERIVAISAFTANGDQKQLRTALIAGLEAGLTINEIKEELVQLYAYCGFPKSLNGITTFMAVLEERRAKGIQDQAGPEGQQVETTDKYEKGRKTLEALTGKSQREPLTGANAFAPGIDVFLKEHLFADIFGRGILTYQQRELVTIATLATIPGLGSQLEAHIGMGMHVGLTQAQLLDVFTSLEKSIGKQQANVAKAILTKVISVNAPSIKGKNE